MIDLFADEDEGRADIIIGPSKESATAVLEPTATETKPSGDNIEPFVIPDWIHSAPVLVADIETGGLPLDYLQSILPAFEPESVKHPGEFDPSTVK